MKLIFVTGGVVSGLGKGIVAASLGRLLKARGLKVSSQKLDPYMNIDPGTMSPFQHGEVFVTDDGAETDLDLGHYERFIDENLTQYSNLTSGRVYHNVLEKERRGDYLGETVQIIPHVTNEIKLFISKNQSVSKSDVAITEIGGTTGDIEQQAFLEAARQMAITLGRENCLFIHVCLVPFVPGSDEYKSKPTQHSVHELQGCGINPDIIVARCDGELPQEIKEKIALFCNVPKECVITNKTLPYLYEVPLMLHSEGLDDAVCKRLGIEGTKADLTEWEGLVQKIKDRKGTLQIALVGKYVRLHDSYLSVVEALNHASFEHGVELKIKWVDSDTVNSNSAGEIFKDCEGVILPGGFGTRGVEGMIATARYCRESGLPYFGICLGMQVIVIEYARNVLGIEDAGSSEFSDTKDAVIDLMPGQSGVQKGASMRLGTYPCVLKPETILSDAYKKEQIDERHRHRYEFNNAYRAQMERAGLILSGVSPDGALVEAVELDRKVHKFFIGVQFHPEFKSRPNRAHPLFLSFLGAALSVSRKVCE